MCWSAHRSKAIGDMFHVKRESSDALTNHAQRIVNPELARLGSILLSRPTNGYALRVDTSHESARPWSRCHLELGATWNSAQPGTRGNPELGVTRTQCDPDSAWLPTLCKLEVYAVRELARAGVPAPVGTLHYQDAAGVGVEQCILWMSLYRFCSSDCTLRAAAPVPTIGPAMR